MPLAAGNDGAGWSYIGLAGGVVLPHNVELLRLNLRGGFGPFYSRNQIDGIDRFEQVIEGRKPKRYP